MGTAWKKIAGAGEVELPVLQSHRPRSFKAHYLLKRSRHYHAKDQIHVPKPTNGRLETKRKRTSYGGRVILIRSSALLCLEWRTPISPNS
jgi:hypothetical protein